MAAAASLSPSRLRFGGSGADDLLYSFSDADGACAGLPPPNPSSCHYVTPGCLNASHFSSLLGLLASNAPGAPEYANDFIFGLSFNISEAARGLPWSPANANRLLAFLGWPSDTVWGFELGNEVNNPRSVKPAQQAEAVLALSRLLGPSGRIVGPDSGYTNAEAWDAALLPLVRAGGVSLHAVTHHVYLSLMPGDFSSAAALASKLDSCLPEISWYTALARSQAPASQIWAGENGPIGGGDDGTCGKTTICGKWGSAVWYADDAALRAKHGFAQHNRQDLFGGAYVHSQPQRLWHREKRIALLTPNPQLASLTPPLAATGSLTAKRWRWLSARKTR